MPIRLEAPDFNNRRLYPGGVTVHAIDPLTLQLAIRLEKRGFGVRTVPSSLSSIPGEGRWWAEKFTPDGYEVFSLMQKTGEFRTLRDALNMPVLPGFRPDSDNPFLSSLEASCWSKTERLGVTAFRYSRMADIALMIAGSVKEHGEKKQWAELWSSLSQRVDHMLQPDNLQLLSEDGLFELINPAINFHLPDPEQEREYAARHVESEFREGRTFFHSRYLLRAA